MPIIEEEAVVADGGTRLLCRLFRDDGLAGAAPAVIVFPDLWGIGMQAFDWSRRLAGQGYVALAADPFGEAAQATSLANGLDLMDHVVRDPARWRGRARCILDHLADRDDVDAGRIGAIGFCFGGSTVLELARSGAALAAGICVHGDIGRTSAQEAAAVRARLLVCNGAEDPIVPVEQCRQLAADLHGSGVDWRLHLLGGVGHSFTNPEAGRAGMPGVEFDYGATSEVVYDALRFLDATFRTGKGIA